MRLFQRPEMVPIYAAIRDPDTGQLVNISVGSVVVSINKPDGTLIVTEAAMTNVATGIYLYQWLSAADSDIGWYKTTVIIKDGVGAEERITVEVGGFELE